LNKKKQKFKAKDQFQSFSRTKSPRNASEKIAIRTLSPKAAAHLLTYDTFAKNMADKKLRKIIKQI